MTEAGNIHDAQAPEVGLPPGTKIGKYEILGRIAIGGQAIVYKGYDSLLDRHVAIKQISSHLAADPRFLERFRREAQLLARLGSERSNIVAVYDLVQDATGLYIVMEHIEGHTLRAILDHQKGAIPVQPALEILWHIASGLRVAHAQGIVHRDIKPANVLVNRQYRAKITDFGVAATKGGQESMALGTTKYMAPELFEGGAVDARVDIYSLGFIAYEMLTGREFFNQVFHDVVRDPHSENLRWMKWHSDPQASVPALAEVNPAVPQALSDIIARMMAKRPAERYESVEQVMDDLRSAVGGRKKKKARRAAEAAATAQEAIEAAPEAGEALALPPEGGEDVDTEPTAEIPKEAMSLRKKIIIGASAAGAAVLALIVVLVVIVSGQKGRVAEAGSAFAAAYKQQYTVGVSAGSVSEKIQRFEQAAKQFGAIAREYSDLRVGVSAKARELMSEAYLAMYRGDWAKAEQLSQRAKDIPEPPHREIPQVAKEIPEFNRLLRLRQDGSTLLQEIEDRLGQREFDQAEAALARLRELSPPADMMIQAQQLGQQLLEGRQDVAFELAMIDAEEALSRKDYQEADASRQRAQAIRPADPKVAELDKRIQTGWRYDQTIRTYQKAMDDGDFQTALRALRDAETLIPSDANRTEIDRLQAAIHFNQAQDESSAGRLAEALALAQQAVALDASKAEYAQFADELAKRIERNRLVGQARTAIRRRSWDQAIELLQQAVDLGADPDVEQMLADARYEKHLDEGDAAVRDKRWTDAAEAYEKARGAKAGDATAEQRVTARLDKLALEREYDSQLTKGLDALMQKRYDDAITALEPLIKIETGLDVPQGQAKRLLTDAKYERELKKGKDAMDARNWSSARGYLRLAQTYKDTDEVKALLTKVDEEIAKGGG